MEKNVIFQMRLDSIDQREEYHKKAKEHGFESLSQFIKWLIHNSDRLLQRVVDKVPNDPGSKTD